ncbi:MAG: hypothetical protein RJQ14_15440 [Marinoscillum sp.]
MNKSVLLSIGLPITIMSLTGRIATLELNTSDFVICRYHPNNPVYLQDADLEGWLPVNALLRLIYKWKVLMSQRKT